MRSDTDATRVADCFILDFPCLCEASGQPMTLLGARRRLCQTSIGTPLVAAVNPGPPGCVSAAIGARNWLRARTTASPIRRMGTWWRMAGGSLADLLAVAAEEQKNGDEAGGSHVVASSRDARDGRQSKIEFLSRRNRRRRSCAFHLFVRSGSRRPPQVFVMQSTNARHLHHPAFARQLHTPSTTVSLNKPGD